MVNCAKILLLQGLTLLPVWTLWAWGIQTNEVAAQPTPIVITDAEAYFPDQPGFQWRYRGRLREGLVNEIADVMFENISTVKGEEVINGITLTVFHDTNPGNQGPSDSYYRRDAAGIRYYGSKPGTTLERQMVPYQIIRFPIEIPSSFQQLNRKGLDLGLDLDRDGRNERVDVRAAVAVKGQESVSVPFGTYPKAIRMEARMVMRVHLSKSGRIVRGSDVMTVWFAKGVGLIKYAERQLIPLLNSGKDRLIEITEELEEAILDHQPALSLQRSKTPPKRVLTYHPLHHELLHVSFPASLEPDP
ncbi:MAG: hypothetical protein D6704_11665 [Nitrospirae bacterium]|nr:MAG: hypothetical protein D6704_11665 [Nitrospirota bacterium]